MLAPGHNIGTSILLTCGLVSAGAFLYSQMISRTKVDPKDDASAIYAEETKRESAVGTPFGFDLQPQQRKLCAVWMGNCSSCNSKALVPQKLLSTLNSPYRVILLSLNQHQYLRHIDRALEKTLNTFIEPRWYLGSMEDYHPSNLRGQISTLL